MIRFMPDSWLQALLRPVAMAAPDGGVYVETIAPDFRFVFALLLLAALAVLAVLRRRSPRAGAQPTFVLLAFCAIAFVPWLATTGNGRYFMGVLVLAGPLCAALLWVLPVTRALRMALLGLMVGLQLFLVHENTPWDSWGLTPWKDGNAFAVDVPQDLRSQPITYITLTSISYSIIAPQFGPQAHWISLASQTTEGEDSPDGRRTRAFLVAARDMRLLFPSLPGERAGTRPSAELVTALDEMLHIHGLRIDPEPCRLLHSRGLTNMGLRRGDPPITDPALQRGFWLCRVARQPEGAPRGLPQATPEVEAVFEKIERTCPRMFPPGEAKTTLLGMGARRFYTNSDMRLYVMNDGQVVYKYMRALNAVTLGATQDVLAPGFHMDCGGIRGRTGLLPWDREI